jgi:hypothetical protein
VTRGCERVLVVTKRHGESFHLCEQLARHGCRCWFASSADEIVRLLDDRSFDLVLSTIWLQGCVVAKLADSRSTAFFAHPLRNGCWWLPVLDQGQNCVGAPALRPGQLGALVRSFLREAQQVNSVAT